ncbi:MAG TPA: alpha/beta hydrolase family protein [Membranihabitans sp.]|nr:alpha/beta hydrolase family protein [Membranihabitans sp.]
MKILLKNCVLLLFILCVNFTWCSASLPEVWKGGPSPEREYPGPGTVYESLQFYSEILGRDVSFSVYLPPNYEGSTVNFPVLYLLHGYSDDETGWIQFGQVQRIADKAIAQHKSAQMIIVMPDAGVTWYVNTAAGKENYEDFMVQEFIPHIDAEFRTRKDRQYRAVAGLSMGGYGALMLALRHPDLFSTSGVLSAGVFTDEEMLAMNQERWDRSLGLPFGEGLTGEARLSGNYQEYSPQAMIDSYKEKDHTTRFYIDCGDDDFLILGNLALHAQMIKAEIPHEFRVRDGGHSWSYWRTALPRVLAFASDVFHR